MEMMMKDEIPACEVLSPRGAAAYTGVSESTLAKLRLTGGGPRFLKLTYKISYRRSDLDAWMASKTHSSTSEYAAGAR